LRANFWSDPVFTIVLGKLSIELQFHPFKSYETLIQFYELYFAKLEISRFKFIALYLVLILPIVMVPESHLTLFVHLLASSLNAFAL